MKLVLKYTGGDGCSYSFTETIPFNYESVEKAEYDFLELVEKAHIERKDFDFSGYNFDHSYFFYKSYDYRGQPINDGKEVYDPPEILSLEDWFEKHKGN